MDKLTITEVSDKLQSSINYAKLQEKSVKDLTAKKAFSSIVSQLEEVKLKLTQVNKKVAVE